MLKRLRVCVWVGLHVEQDSHSACCSLVRPWTHGKVLGNYIKGRHVLKQPGVPKNDVPVGRSHILQVTWPESLCLLINCDVRHWPSYCRKTTFKGDLLCFSSSSVLYRSSCIVHVKGPHRRELLSPTENTLLKRLVNSPIFALHPVCQHVTHLHSLRLYSQ